MSGFFWMASFAFTCTIPWSEYVVEKVDVPIPAQTRFLTLVTTCSGRADYSWIFFGDPFLE